MRASGWTLVRRGYIRRRGARGRERRAQALLCRRERRCQGVDLLKADGSIVVTTASGKSIEINGNGKTFVTGSELQTALTTLCATLTAHVHPAHGTPAPSLVGLACDITSAKTTTVKTGG